MIIIFFGPPGSGKGTQASLLEKNDNFTHISTGSLLRDEIDKKSIIGLKIKDIVEKGDFPANDILYELISKKLNEEKGNFLFDGFPRNIEQAIYFEKHLKKNSLLIDYAVFFDIEDDILIKRLTGRQLCPKCTATYNIFLNPPVQENICNECGHLGLVKRKDDDYDAVIQRIKVYNEKTKPLKDFYFQKGFMRSVQAINSSKIVYAEIKNIINH